MTGYSTEYKEMIVKRMLSAGAITYDYYIALSDFSSHSDASKINERFLRG